MDLFLSQGADSTAPSSFLSGAMFSTWGSDQHVAYAACVAENDKLTRTMDSIMLDIEDDTWNALQSLIPQAGRLYAIAAQGCNTDEYSDAWDLLTKTTNTVDNFKAQDNYMDILNANYEANSHIIDGYAAQMTDAWDAGLYNGAGSLAGLIGTYLLVVPEVASPNTASDGAPASFLAGGLASAWGQDLHSQVEACVAPNDKLTRTMDSIMLDIEDDSWNALQSLIPQAVRLYVDAVQGCTDGEWPDVQNLLMKTQDYWVDFQAQENYEDIIRSNYAATQHAVDGYTAQMTIAWDAGLYNQAGSLMGLIATYLLTYEGTPQLQDETFMQSLPEQFAEQLPQFFNDVFTLI